MFSRSRVAVKLAPCLYWSEKSMSRMEDADQPCRLSLQIEINRSLMSPVWDLVAWKSHDRKLKAVSSVQIDQMGRNRKLGNGFHPNDLSMMFWLESCNLKLHRARGSTTPTKCIPITLWLNSTVLESLSEIILASNEQNRVLNLKSCWYSGENSLRGWHVVNRNERQSDYRWG